MAGTIFQTDTLIYVGKIIGFIGIGSFLDRIVGSPWREKLSTFIYGAKGASLKDFEVSLITSLVELFCRRSDLSRLSLLRVLAYTGWVLALQFIGTLAWLGAPETRTDYLVLMGLLLGPIPIAFAADLWSISVTKRIFYYRPGRLALLPIRIALDLVITIVPVFVFSNIYQFLFPHLFEMRNGLEVVSAFLAIGLVYSLLGSCGVTLIQVVSLLGGILLRGVTAIMSSKVDASSIEALRKTPFTAIFIAMAVPLAIADALI